MDDQLAGCIDLKEHLLLRGAPGDVSFPDGWRQHIAELDQALARLDPRYQLAQVKEKFGGLRYYMHPSASTSQVVRWEMGKLVHDAELASYTMCSRCGDVGSQHRSPQGYYDTLCAAHVPASKQAGSQSSS